MLLKRCLLSASADPTTGGGCSLLAHFGRFGGCAGNSVGFFLILVASRIFRRIGGIFFCKSSFSAIFCAKFTFSTHFDKADFCGTIAFVIISFPKKGALDDDETDVLSAADGLDGGKLHLRIGGRCAGQQRGCPDAGGTASLPRGCRRWQWLLRPSTTRRMPRPRTAMPSSIPSARFMPIRPRWTLTRSCFPSS